MPLARTRRALTAVTRSCATLLLAAGAACTRTTTHTEIAPGPTGLLLSPASSWAADPRIGLRRDSAIAAALGEIDPARIRATDSTLVAFGTRNTLSDTLSPARGVGAARRWLHAQLEAISRDCGGCLRVAYDPAIVAVPRHPDSLRVNVVNVLGILPGRDTTRVIVVGGHYDSCTCAATPTGAWDVTSDAPGADDDGSGTSAVVEAARVVSRRWPHGLDATIVFALYAGEEQGLLGSTHLAERLTREGKTIVAAFTNDIVGNVVAEDGTTDSTSVRVYAADPDSGATRELGRYVWGIGALHLRGFEVRPTWRLDRIGRGGDHSPFVRAGWPGLRFTERLENYKRQHLPTDDFAHVSFGYVAQVARLNAATIVSLAAAPPPPDSVYARRESSASGGQAWTVTWHDAPGAAGYELLVRRTTAPTWERVVPVGRATNYTLDFQLDDGWVAVRSVGATGHRSLARAAAPAPRAPARQTR